jgi:hypothetical protein
MACNFGSCVKLRVVWLLDDAAVEGVWIQNLEGDPSALIESRFTDRDAVELFAFL